MTADLVLISVDTTHWTAKHSWNSNRTIQVEMVSKMVCICCSWCHRELLRRRPYTLHVMSSSAQTSTILVIRLYAECNAICQGYANPTILALWDPGFSSCLEQILEPGKQDCRDVN